MIRDFAIWCAVFAAVGVVLHWTSPDAQHRRRQRREQREFIAAIHDADRLRRLAPRTLPPVHRSPRTAPAVERTTYPAGAQSPWLSGASEGGPVTYRNN
jgi:hypothetical protein